MSRCWVAALAFSFLLSCGDAADQGWEAYRRSGPEAARAVFSRMLEDPKRSAEAQLALAEIALEQDLLEEAAERYGKASAGGRFAEGQAGLGEALMRMGREREALEAWLAALERELDGPHTARIAGMTGGAYRVTRLTRTTTDNYSPRFHPDGDRIAFASHAEESADLMMLSLPEMRLERLTSGSDSNEHSPTFSSDGEMLAYAATQQRTGVGYITLHASGTSSRNVILMKLDMRTGAEALLTPNPGSVGNPSFHPKRMELAFEAVTDENLDIWRMDADGGNRTRLTTSPEDDGSPVYTPDGRALVFVQTQGENFELMEMPADGGEASPLTRTPYNEFMGSFTPDGSRLVYFRQRGSYELAEMDWRTGRTRTLARGLGSSIQPNVSPDGSKIVFVSDRSDYMELYLMDRLHPETGASVLRRVRFLLGSLSGGV